MQVGDTVDLRVALQQCRFCRKVKTKPWLLIVRGPAAVSNMLLWDCGTNLRCHM